MDEIKKYLGIDWGKAKVGLALADDEMRIALAYTTLKNDKNIITSICEIIKKEEIDVVVMGVPVYFNKEEKDFGGKKIAEKIGEISGVEVIFQNEIFTTQSAQKNLIEAGAKKIKLDDAEAARIILQSYLDTTKNRF